MLRREYRPGSDSWPSPNAACGSGLSRNCTSNDCRIRARPVCHILGAGLPAGADHRPADLILELRQSADEIAREIKALGGRDARRC